MTSKKEIKKILLSLKKKESKKKKIFILFLIIFLIFFYRSNIFNLDALFTGIPAFLTIIGEMFPPDFSNISNWINPSIDSVSMSITATILSSIIAFPISLIASRNINSNFYLYTFIRLFLSFFRSIPEIILGLIIVISVGFGILSGTLAITIHSVGMLGKFFSESIERSNNDITEIVTSTGATKKTIIFYGIIPQVLQEFIDLMMYRWEYNFRQSTILGIVGAGGIGFELLSSIRLMQYQEVLAILIIIISLVTLIDFLSSKIRSYFREH